MITKYNLVEIFKMRFTVFFLFFFFLILGCSEKPQQSFYNLINDNFLTIVDTTAYKTGRLIQIPNDTLHVGSLNKVCICVDAAFVSSSELNKSILKSFQENNLKDFEELLLKGNYLNLDSIDITQLTNTGKYLLTKSAIIEGTLCSTIAGKITFYKPYITQSKAIIVYSISTSPKSGFTNCWLFRKQNGVWKNIKRIEIEKW